MTVPHIDTPTPPPTAVAAPDENRVREPLDDAVALDLAPRSTDGLPTRFGRNVVMNYLAVGVSAAATVIVTPILLRELGPLAFGIWALASSLVSYLELFEFGFGPATAKLVAEDAYRSSDRVSVTLSTSFFVLCGFGIVALAVGGVVAVGAPSWFDAPDALRAPTMIAIGVLALSLAVSIPGDTFGGALGGYQRYDLRSLTNITHTVLWVFASIAVLNAGGGLVPLAMVSAAIGLALQPVRWVLLRRIDRGLRLSPRLVDRSRLRSVANLSGWLFVGKLGVFTSYRIDAVVVGAVLGVKAVAVFVIGSRLAKLAERALTQMSTVFVPHASALSTEGNTSELRRLLLDGTRATMIIVVPLSVVMALLAHPIVELWVGPEYDEAARVLVVFCLYTIVHGFVDTSGTVAIGSGRARHWALATAGESVVNVTLSIALALTVGLIGVALGTLIATAAVLVPALLLVTCRATGLPVRHLLREAILPHLLPCGVTAAAVYPLRSWAGSNLGALLATVVVGAAVYLTVYWFTGASDWERARLRHLVSSIREVRR